MSMLSPPDGAEVTGVPETVRLAQPTVWFNPKARFESAATTNGRLSFEHLRRSVDLWQRSARCLQHLFQELGDAESIASPLVRLSDTLSRTVLGRSGRVLVKADHDLPLTGTIKARGGMFEVLAYAEALALEHGMMEPGGDLLRLIEPDVREVFGRHTVVVGSTGNLGYAVGLMARKLGFQAEVNLSNDAKAWKKDRLRDLGVTVVEHAGDFTAAVAAARNSVENDRTRYLVDDERSLTLFIGYAAAAFEIRAQLEAMGVSVGEQSPLIVHLPCGVGGAPGGITFGLKSLFGRNVKCVFVEPVEAPCMLVQLAAGPERPVSVYDVGLRNRTEADGLAVAMASQLVTEAVGDMIDAVVTVTDDDLFGWSYRMWSEAAFSLEPSGAAGFASVVPFDAALRGTDIARLRDSDATHIVWTTGGSRLPRVEHDIVLARGRRVASLRDEQPSGSA